MRFVSILFALSMSAGNATADEGNGLKLVPADGAVSVNPDTHLVVTLAIGPTLGKSGKIRIFDTQGDRLVDVLDLGIPSGPHVSLAQSAADAKAREQDGLPEPVYQETTIGGQQGFHFHPVIVHGRVATIYPHNGALQYGRTYRVVIDAGVFGFPGGESPMADKPIAWTFATRTSAPDTGQGVITVAADGSGDFNTVQGAIDAAPANPENRFTIVIRNGNYEEIVFARQKSNLTIRGEDRDGVVVGYGNNSSFNPSRDDVSLRPAFSLLDSTGLLLENFTIRNYYIGQAEALKVSGSRNTLRNMTLEGSGDALNLRGPIYIADTKLTGDGDTILGWGPAFFERCEIHSIGPFQWIRNPETNHGNVFKDCMFIGRDEPLPWTRTADGGGRKVDAVIARLPNNHGLNYPFAEAVLINARMDGIAPVGWGPVEDAGTFDWSNVHFWEYNSTNLDGTPVDMSQRHPIVRELLLPGDADLIRNYSDPAFVLGGWDPLIR